MTDTLAVTGCGVWSAAGKGLPPLSTALTRWWKGELLEPTPVGGMFDISLPTERAHVARDFDVQRELGRKGTSCLDRRSALAMAACGEALRDAGLQVDAASRSRIGITLGTTCGSFKSMSDYTMQTLVEPRPYMVDPLRFPNTVLNCAAGVSAIRHGLRGVNATIAGGQLAFLSSLSYASWLLRRGYADALLVGGVEEYTPHTAWATHLAGADVLPGEGAAVFAIERLEVVRRARRRVDAEVLSLSTAFAPGGARTGRLADALASCIRRALSSAGASAADVSNALTCEPAREHSSETQAVMSVIGPSCRRFEVKRMLGECNAANGALQLAAVMASHRSEPGRDGEISLLTAATRDGGVGAALIKGLTHVSTDSG